MGLIEMFQKTKIRREERRKRIRGDPASGEPPAGTSPYTALAGDIVNFSVEPQAPTSGSVSAKSILGSKFQPLKRLRRILYEEGADPAYPSAKPGTDVVVKVPDSWILSVPEGASVNAYLFLKNDETNEQIAYHKQIVEAKNMNLAWPNLHCVMPTDGSSIRLRIELMARNPPHSPTTEWYGLDKVLTMVNGTGEPAIAPVTPDPLPPPIGDEQPILVPDIAPVETAGEIGPIQAPPSEYVGNHPKVAIPFRLLGDGRTEKMFIILSDLDTNAELKGQTYETVAANGAWHHCTLYPTMPNKTLSLIARLWLSGQPDRFLAEGRVTIQSLQTAQPDTPDVIETPPTVEPEPETPAVEPYPVETPPTIQPPPDDYYVVPDPTPSPTPTPADPTPAPADPAVPWWVTWLKERFPRLQRAEDEKTEHKIKDVRFKAR